MKRIRRVHVLTFSCLYRRSRVKKLTFTSVYKNTVYLQSKKIIIIIYSNTM